MGYGVPITCSRRVSRSRTLDRVEYINRRRCRGMWWVGRLMQERLARIIHECGLVNNPGRIPAFFNTPGTVLIRPSLSLYPASTFSARRSLKTKIFMASPPLSLSAICRSRRAFVPYARYQEDYPARTLTRKLSTAPLSDSACRESSDAAPKTCTAPLLVSCAAIVTPDIFLETSCVP